MDCPLCASGGARALSNPRRAFLRCPACGFAWAAEGSRPDAAASRERYALHRNDPGDPGYAAYLSAIADAALAACPRPPRSILDWGSGPVPAMARILEGRGFGAATWDPFFAPEPVPAPASFDLVLCVEVAEHFADPAADFLAMASRLRPGGVLAVHTGLAPEDDEAFLSWWYVEDPTHVSFFSEAGLRFLARCASLRVLDVGGGKPALFRRPLSALAVGGANLDVEGRPAGELKPRDSNPGSVRFFPGGAARNSAEDLARLGVGVCLLAPVGEDGQGADLAARTAAAGVDVSGVARVPGEATSAYVSLLDGEGDMAAAVSGMGICERFSPAAALEALDACEASARDASFAGDGEGPFSAVLLDANLQPGVLEAVLDRLPGAPAWFDPTSTAKARRFALHAGGRLVSRLRAAKPNLVEARAMAEALGSAEDADPAAALLAAGVGIVHLSQGPLGSLTAEGESRFAFEPPPARVASATGAGDAFLAGALRAELLGLDPREAAVAGACAASFALEAEGACPSAMDGPALERRAAAWKRSGIAGKEKEE